MAINARNLETQIIDAFTEYNNGDYKNGKTIPKHLKILGDEMKKYFEDNTEISYGWAAKLPEPASTPDPVIKFDSTVKFPSFNLTAAVDLITLALLVQTAILGGIISHATGFTVSPGSYLLKSPLVFPLTTTAESAIYNCICVPTCTWVLTLTNPAPLAGSHTAYIGATTSMSIS